MSKAQLSPEHEARSTRSDREQCIVIAIQHPADVHFFKHAIKAFEASGHSVHVFVRQNEVNIDLLETYGIDHTVLVGELNSLTERMVMQPIYEYRLWRHVRRLDPDVMASFGGVTVSHVATLVGARAIAFTDTEHATIVNRLTTPFADTVCTPECYYHDIGAKQVLYRGYKELAYLHPNHFEPDPSVLEDIEHQESDMIVVVRLSAWDSSHDIGAGGVEDFQQVVETLSAAGARVLISSEVEVPSDLEAYQLDIEPDRMHDLLYHADLYFGEGATMAAESAVLGTPAVYINSLSMGYIDDLRDHGLLYSFNGEDRQSRSLARAESLLTTNTPPDWEGRQKRLLSDTVDVTEVIVDVIEGRRKAGSRPPPATDQPPVRPKGITDR